MTESKAITFLIVFILAGLVLISFSLFSNNGELICEQAEPSEPVLCEFIESNAFVSNVQEFELFGADLAEGQETQVTRLGLPRGTVRQGTTIVYWVALRTSNGPVSMAPVMGKNSIINAALNLERSLDALVDDPTRNTFRYRSEPVIYATPLAGMVGFVMIALGVFLIYRIWRFRPENISRFQAKKRA